MSKKPGLFSRLKTSISSALNDAVDAVSDPGQEVALMLDDLRDSLQKAEADLKQALVDRKMMEKKIEKLEVDEKAWQRRAEQALNGGDEKLARAALEKKKELTMELGGARSALVQQRQYVEDLARDIKSGKAKYKTLNLKRGTLVAQARAMKDSQGAGDFGASVSTSRISEIEAKIANIEAMNEVHAEMEGLTADEVEMDRKLAALDPGTSELDDELAALKRKLSGQNALTEGDSKDEESKED
jgi:phage shock protein A